MKKVLLLVLAAGLAVALVSRGGLASRVQSQVDRAAEDCDPAAIALDHDEGALVQFTVLPD
ncbi:hypothetical protein [Luteolibacter luteus]|uniref:Uncharacterized protein n=1 Tax=Luteolibacter luteus TaxID=2728835 RepID=A0A858RFR3_9BACT|nr:hypothetical protein [Luteolibacter luteus]QJE95592.1 hypothetical protein HHL09_07255 [Luteolibacter luteus]